MKGLNLINTMEKQKMTGIKVSVIFWILTTAFALLSATNLWGWNAVPVWNGSNWCSYYNSNELHENGWGTGTKLNMINGEFVYMPCQDRIDYEYKTSKSSTQIDLKATYKSYDSNCTSANDITNWSTGHKTKTSNWTSDNSHWFGSVPENTYQLTITRSGGTLDMYIRKVTLLLKKHIRFDNGTDCGTDNLIFDKTSETYNFGEEHIITVPIRSFLADGNITVSFDDTYSNSDAFYIQTTGFTLVNSGSNICAVRNSSTNDPTASSGAASTLYNASCCDVKIKYRPTSTLEESCKIKITCGTSTAYATIKAKGTESFDFGTVTNYNISTTKSFLPAYKGTSSDNVSVTISKQGQHYQIKNKNSSTWETGTNTIQLSSDETFDVRFTPTDAQGETDGTGTGYQKEGTISISQGQGQSLKSYTISIKGTPKVATTSLSHNLNLTGIKSTDSPITIDRNTNFTVTATTPLEPGHYNSTTVKSNIVLSAPQNNGVVSINDNVVTILGAGTTKITAKLPALKEHYTTSSCDIDVTVSKVDLTSLTWSPSPTEVTKHATTQVTLAAPVTDPPGISYSKTTYNSAENTKATINGNKATFKEAGLYDLWVTVSENAKYNDKSSAKVPFKVNFTGFGDVELGSYSTAQSFTIADSRYTSGSLTINAPTDFQVKTGSGDWGSQIQLTLSTTPVSFEVRFAPTTVSAGEQERTLTVGSESFTIKGTTVWKELNFGSTKVGQASIQDITDINGTFNITVPDGYMVRVDNESSWLTGTISSKSISSTLHVKFQPHSGSTDYDNKKLQVTNTSTSKTTNYNLRATVESNTIAISQSIGLAKNTTFEMTDFTAASGAAVTVGKYNGTDIDYFVSADGTTWSTSATVTSGMTLYVKFQPSDDSNLHSGNLIVTSNGKTYNIEVSGTGSQNVADKGKATVLQYAVYGPEYGDWYYFTYFPNTSDPKVPQRAYDNLILHSKVKVHIEANNSTNDFKLNNWINSTQFTTDDITVTYTDQSNCAFRVGYFPTQTASAAQQCTIKIKDDDGNGKTYTFVVKYSQGAVEQTTAQLNVGVGKASTYQKIEKITFFGFGDNGTATVQSDDDCLFSTTGGAGDSWHKEIQISNKSGYDNFYVKYVPKNNSSGNKRIQVVDDSDNSRVYYFNVIGQGAPSSVPQLSATVDSESDVKSFTMDNFTTEGTVTVTVKTGQGFQVCGPDGQYKTSTTLPKGTLSFNVKQTAQNAVDTYYGTIEIKDDVTGRTYVIGASCVVGLKTGTIIVPTDKVIFLSTDAQKHTLVGTGYPVHGSITDMDDGINLNIEDGATGGIWGRTYAEVTDKNKAITVTNNITNGHEITVKASFPGNTKVKAVPEADEPTFKIIYQEVTNLGNSRAWQNVNGVWYVYYNNNLSLGTSPSTLTSNIKNNIIDIYQPNEACVNASYAVGCSSAFTQNTFGSNLYYNDLSNRLVKITGVKNEDYTPHPFTLPEPNPKKGKNVQLMTITDANESGEMNERPKTAHISITLPQHYETKTYAGADFGDVEVGEVAYYDIPLTDLFVSFLTTNGLKISAATGCSTDIFFANTASHSTAMELVPANSVISPNNSLSNNTGLAAGSNNQYYLRLYFKPQATGSYSGSFTLSDDGNSSLSMTISVSGKGVVSGKEPQSILWDQDLSQLVYSGTGTNSVTLSAKSTSGLDVSYPEDKITVDGSPGITINNGVMSFTGAGTAKITATCAEGTKNGIKYDKATDVEKEVTISTTVPKPSGDCESSTASITPQNWSVSVNQDSYKLNATEGFTWSQNHTAYKMTCSLTLNNCSTAEVTLYVNGTDDDHKLDTYTATNNSISIDLTGKNVTNGSKFYCSFDGTRKNAGTYISQSFGFSITNVKIYYNPGLTAIPTGDVNFGSQRVGQSGITKQIKAVNYSGIKGTITASITGTNADCFTLITDKNPASITANCDAGTAIYDVQFHPTKAGNLTANLHVTDPLGESVNITLNGTATKRDLKVKWAYGATARSIDAVGNNNTLTWNATDTAVAYDKLRGETAQTVGLVDYVITYGTDVQRLYSDAGKQDLVEIIKDADNKVTGVKATGYGSGTVYITATVPTGNDIFNAITADADKVKLTLTVNKVEADVIVTTDMDGQNLYYGDRVITTGATAYLHGTTTEIEDQDGGKLTLANGRITFAKFINCESKGNAPDGYNRILHISGVDDELEIVVSVGDAIVVAKNCTTTFSKIKKIPLLIVNKLSSSSDTKTVYTDVSDVDLLGNVYYIDQRHSSESIGGQGAVPYFTGLYNSTTGECKLYNQMKLGTSVSYTLKQQTLNTGCTGDIGQIVASDNGGGTRSAKFNLTKSATGRVEFELTTTGIMDFGTSSTAQQYENTAKQTFYVEVQKSTPLLYLSDGTGEHLGTSGAEYTRTIAYGDVIQLSARAESKNDDNVVFYNSTDDLTISVDEGTGGYISEGKLYATTPGQTIRVKVHQNSNCLANETNNNYYLYTVVKAKPTITVSTETMNLIYPDDLQNGKPLTLTSTNNDPGWTWGCSVSTENMVDIAINGNYVTIKPKENVGSTIITFTCPETNNYYSASAKGVVVHVNWGTFTISLDEDKLPPFTSTTVVNLNTIEGFVTNSFFSKNVSYEYKVSGTAESTVSEGILSVKSVGTVALTVKGTHNISDPKLTDTKSTEKDHSATRGTLEFKPNDDSDDKWFTAVNWSPHRDRIPNPTNFNVLISAPCVISTASSDQISALSDVDYDAPTTTAQCNDLTIGSDGSLTVAANQVLNVTGSIINNQQASDFVLNANTTNSATVVFAEGSPAATIQMYFKGHTHEEYGGGYKNPEWQYRGIIGKQPSNWPNNIKAFWWNEALSGGNTSCWVEVKDNSSLTSWTGYCMANMTKEAATYTYTTTLLPNYNAEPTTIMKEYQLSFTPDATVEGDTMKNGGVNIFTNSFSAPICVGDLIFNNMDAQVWFFYNDYYLNWKKAQSTAYKSCPKETCGAVHDGNDQIPAGHGFLVQATKNAGSNLVIPAGAVVRTQASGPYYAPTEKPHYNILEIRISSDSIDDELFLLENENCSWRYDNGYDGTKMFADGLPQIYAKNKFGNTSINADSSMLGQYIGFRGIPELTEYEMKFNTDRLEGFTELYLFDHLTKRYADILAGGTYHFSATEGDDPQRFQIMGRRDDGTYFTGEEQWIEVVCRQALLHGFDNDNEPIYITDLMGKRAWSDNSKNGPWFDLPDLPAGVYIIHCGKATAKFISK